ncbi:MAG: hypothetical protein KDC00_07530 [Flavobacteriales bacterium]|nr:hypothetical protein [Flavobacteriales bacterium]
MRWASYPKRIIAARVQAGPWVMAALVTVASHFSAAQQHTGAGVERLPPLSDTVLDGHLRATLIHMDAFSADSSMARIGQALAYEASHPDPEARYYLLSYRAEVLYYEGLFNEAMRDLNICDGLARELGDSTLIANIFNLKGLLHENIQDSRQALPFLYEALAYYPERPKARYPLSELHHIHGNLGSYLTTLGRSDSAAFHLRRSLELASEAGGERAIAVAWWSMGNLALRQGRTADAEVDYSHSIRVAHAARDHDIGVDALVGRAEAIAAQGRRDAAINALDSAEAYLNAYRSGIGLVTQRNFVRRASGIYRIIGEYKGAIERLATWHRIDSTITARNIETSLRTQADLMRSDSELAMAQLRQDRMTADLERERERRTMITIASTIGLIVLTVLFFVLRSRHQAKERLAELEVLRLQQERTIAELRVREEVGRDMHDDLGAGLSALKLRSEMALRKETDPSKQKMLKQLANTAGELIVSMRQIIWTLNDDQLTLADLLAYMGSYVRTYLSDQELNFELITPEHIPEVTLSAQARRNLLLVVKEALHNVVKHAKASHVTLEISCSEALSISIVDDGIGLQRNAELGVGNGLRNMARRMEVLGGTFQVQGTEDEGSQGTRLRILFPLHPNKGSIVQVVVPSSTSSR